MASSTATKKKAATKKAASTKTTKTVKKEEVKTSKAKKVNLPVGLINENNPENHVATGKYKFFFAFFGCTTVIFAAVAVWLFVFSSEVLNKWEELDACARNGETCEVVRREDIKAEAEEGDAKAVLEEVAE